jgi:hypothetical protein
MLQAGGHIHLKRQGNQAKAKRATWLGDAKPGLKKFRCRQHAFGKLS